MPLALGCYRQVTLEASDHPSASPAGAGPLASSAPPTVAVVTPQSETTMPLAELAIHAINGIAEKKPDRLTRSLFQSSRMNIPLKLLG